MKEMKGRVFLEEITNVKEQLATLIKLQEIDEKVYGLMQDQKELPANIQKIEDEFQKKTGDLNQAQDALKALQVKQKEQELSLQQNEENIKKKQTQLLQIKTNKEYQAMVSEIESIKADISKIEEEEIIIMDEIDQVKANVETEDKKLDQERAEMNQKKQEVQKQLEAIQQELDGYKSQRDEIASLVHPQLLEDYERILSSRDGVALVPVFGQTCGGCHLSLRPQLVNEVRLGNTIVKCENCSRIVYGQESEDADE